MNLSRFLKVGLFCACALILVAALAPGARGQTFTWVGTSATGDGNWNDVGSWSGGVIPTGGSTTTIQFNSPTGGVGYNSINDLADNPFLLNALLFNNTTTSAIMVSPNNPFQFAGTTPGITMSGNGPVTIQSNAANPGVVFDTTTPFTIGGAGTGTLTIGGVTDNSVLSGAGTVTVNFANVGSAATPNLSLGDVGTWNGNLNIQSGYVTARSTTGDLFGNSTILQVASGSTFNFNNNGETFGGLQGAGSIVLGSAGMQFVAAGDRSWTGSISGTGGVDQSGGGVFLLGGTNTYTGTTTVGGGTLRVASNTAIPANSLVSITAGTGAVLDLNNFSAAVGGLTGGQSIGAGVTMGSGTLTINITGTRVFNGFLTGTGGLIVNGTGTQTITGQNTYTGATTVNGGTLKLQGAGLQASSSVTVGTGATLDVNFDTNATWATPLSGTGTLSKSGSGTVTFATANPGANFAGLVVANGGVTLDFSTDAGSKLGSNPTLTLGSGVLTVLGNGASATSRTFNGLTLSGGSGKVNVTSGNNQNATVSLGAITRGQGGTLNFGLSNTGTGVAAVSTTTANGSTGILGGWATVNGRDWAATGTGAGPFNVSALPAASYTSNSLAAGVHTDITSNFTAPSGRTTGSIRFNTPSATTLTLGGTNIITSGGILVTPNVGANLTTISTGTVTTPQNQELYVNQYNTAGDLTIASVVGNTAGTALTLTVPNLTNTTTVNLPSTAGLVPGMILTNSTNIPTSLNAHIVSVNSPTQITISFKTDVTSNPASAPTPGTDVPVTFTLGTSVVKSGPGNLNLTGVNTFTGPLIINEGSVTANVVSNLGNSSTSGSSSVIFNGGTLRITGNMAPGNALQPWIFGPSGGTIDVVGANTVTSKQGNSVSGTGPMTKVGDGVFSVGSNVAAFTGPINVNQGVLRLTSNQLRNSANMTVADGAQLYILDTANAPFNVSSGASLILNGDGPGGTGAYRHALDETGSALNGAWNSPVVLATTSRLTVSTQGTLTNRTASDQIVDTFAFPISGPGNLIKDGDGTLILTNGFNHYGGSNGSTIVSNGVLKIAAGNDRVPTNTTLQFGESGSTNAGTVDLNGFNQTVAGLMTAGSGTGHQVLNTSATPSVLTVNYNGASAQTYAGMIGGVLSTPAGNSGGDNLSLVKSGTGTLNLTANSTYTGSTMVQGGTLRVAGNTVSRPYTVADGAGLDVVNVDPSTPFQASSLTLGTSAGTSALTLELTAATLPTTGIVNVSGGGGLVANGKVDVTFSSVKALSLGTIPLVKYNGPLGGAGFAAFSGGKLTLPSRVLGSLVNNTANSSIDLNITGVDFVKWNGNLNANWDINNTLNWKLASNSAGTNYLENPAPGDTVVFDDTATGTKNVNLTTTLKPSAVTVNSAAGYTFGGPGKLSGPTGLTKSGTGTLTVLTNNDYTGATTVTGGTVRVGNGGTVGSLGSGNLSNAGTVIIDRTDDVTLASNISGTGNLTKNGPGTLTLSGSYDQGGDTTIAGGTLELASGGTNSGRIVGPGALLKSGAGTLVLAGATTPGGGISVTGGMLVAAGDVAPGGAGTSVTNGATLQVGNGNATGSLSGNVSLAAATTLAFNRTDGLTFAGGISGDGRVTPLASSGPVKLTGALSYTGTTDIGSGSLEIASASDFNASGRVTGNGQLIKSGAGQLTLLGNNTTFTGTLTVNQGIVKLADLGGGGDLNASNIIINPGGKFIFGQGGVAGENPDFPENANGTFIDINGGEYEIRVGEVWAGTRLRNGGTYRISGGGAAVGSTNNATSGPFTGLQMESGTIIAENTGTGSGTISLGTGVPSIDKTTSGTVTVVGKVAFQAAAPINVQEGTLSFDATNVTTGGGTITLGTSSTAGIFQMTGPGSGSSNRPFNVAEGNGGATAGAFDVADANGTLTLTGTLSNAGTLSKLAKTGPGTLVITPSGYSGLFDVQGGKLRLNPGVSSAAFSVQSGATLAVAPGANPATATVPTLALANGSAVGFELDTASNPTVPLLVVSTPNGLTTSGAVHTLNVSNPQPLTVGQFTLIDYDGTPITGGYTLGSLPARAAASLVYNVANTSIDLNVTGTDSTLWNGNLSADWDTGTAPDVGGTKNFRLLSNSAPTNFIVGDRSTFDDTATGTTTVNLPAAVQPASVTVDNTAKNYVFQGSGSITGGTPLTKRGTGSLTITTDNTYTGLTTVSAGTLSLGNGGTTGSITGPAFVDGGATLTFNRSNDASYNAAITGTGDVSKSGAGTLTLGGSSQFSGTFTVNQGTVVLDDNGGGGDLFASSIVVNNGASFVFGEHGNVDFPDTTIVTVNTGGVFELRQGENFGGVNLKGGTFRMTGTTLAGINPVAAVNGGYGLESGNITTSFSGAATGGVLNGPGSINKTTPGTVTLDGGVTFGTTATLNVREGVLAMPASSFPNGGTTTVTLGDSATNGTIRVLDGASATSARQFDVAPGGGTIDVASAAGAVSLTGALTGSGKLSKAGPGTLNLTSAADLTGPVEVSGGTLVVTGNVAKSAGVTVTGGRFDAAAAQTVKSLTVTGGQARVVGATKVVLTVGDGTASASQLSLTGGKLDLMTNGLAVHYAAGAGNDAAALGSVRAQLIAGYHPSTPTAGDGKWDGATGITSSSIGTLNAVGYALASDVLPFANGATTDTFMGTSVDKSTVLARYTLSGDLNLDGAVDFLDLARLAQSYNVTDGSRQWATGDVNYDGNTDFLDLAKMAQNYNTALPTEPIAGAPADFQADLARAFAAVPEPSMLGLVGLGLLAVRRRRRAA